MTPTSIIILMVVLIQIFNMVIIFQNKQYKMATFISFFVGFLFNAFFHSLTL